jgi:hypothetical protein
LIFNYRGSVATARLVNWFPERIVAVVFAAAGYFPPRGHWDITSFNALAKGALGYETMGYFPYNGEISKDGTQTEASRLYTNNVSTQAASESSVI